MIFSEITNSGAIPVLEASMRFAARRQEIIAGNIANLETPDYRPADVSVSGFRRALAEAVEARRARGGNGQIRLQDSREVQNLPDGTLVLTPRTDSPGILFHDRNNRSLETHMQDLVENTGAFRVASDLLRTRFDLLKMAIAQRV